MKLFLVVSDDDGKSAGVIKRKLEDSYKDFYYSLRNGFSWVVATKNGNATTESVAKSLDITGDTPSAIGVVIKVENYHGRYDPALWEQMATWVEIA